MKAFIGLGALLAASLLFVGEAQASSWCHKCRCHCEPTPACAPAPTTAAAPGTIQYRAGYQPASGEAVAPTRDSGRGMPSPSLPRNEYFWEYQKYRQGRRG